MKVTITFLKGPDGSELVHQVSNRFHNRPPKRTSTLLNPCLISTGPQYRALQLWDFTNHISTTCTIGCGIAAFIAAAAAAAVIAEVGGFMKLFDAAAITAAAC